ncbi:biotin transporter BioY [Ahniella affigens]|uniref:Biotin transporter BioY n=1 Tax=Ahniella affigens TaxID=2021234 RepID=A0A2P1PLQ0_9GAMM|nr:LysR substrate-binding domain-containing protein [Ahniella affigens]AVP95760.1 biotin transporter BioY [Ahniella affigens]
MSQRLPLAALQAFVIAVRAGNLSHAAASMHVTVSALSHQMRLLEQRLGQALLERGPRGIRTTAVGQRLFEEVAPQFDALNVSVTRALSPRDQRLTISVMASVASSWLLPRLPDFVAKYPEIELNLHSSTTLVDFERDGVDCALRFGAGRWPNTEAELMFEEYLTPVASKDLLKRLGRPNLTTLPRYPLLGDPGQRWPLWFARFGGKAPKRYVAQFTDSETLTRAAVEGLGIALGRVTMIRPLVESGRLVQLWQKTLEAEFSHWFVYPSRRAPSPAVQAFRVWVLAEAERSRAANSDLRQSTHV